MSSHAIVAWWRQNKTQLKAKTRKSFTSHKRRKALNLQRNCTSTHPRQLLVNQLDQNRWAVRVWTSLFHSQHHGPQINPRIAAQWLVACLCSSGILHLMCQLDSLCHSCISIACWRNCLQSKVWVLSSNNIDFSDDFYQELFPKIMCGSVNA